MDIAFQLPFFLSHDKSINAFRTFVILLVPGHFTDEIYQNVPTNQTTKRLPAYKMLLGK